MKEGLLSEFPCEVQEGSAYRENLFLKRSLKPTKEREWRTLLERIADAWRSRPCQPCERP